MLLRQNSRQGAGKVRAAMMTVALASMQDADEVAAEGGAAGAVAHQQDGAALVIELWRSDLVSGILELGPGCSITRADTGAGRLLGVGNTMLLQHHLYK